jgi:anti-sigma-K factor RskA
MDNPHISQELADEFAVGALEQGVRDLITLHVAGCQECAARVSEAQDLATMLALGGPLRRPNRRLRRRVFAAAGIGRLGLLHSIVRRIPAASGIAAALAVIVALTGMFMLRSDVSDLQKDRAALQAQVDEALSQEVRIAALQLRLDEGERKFFALQIAAIGDRELLLAVLTPETEVAEVYSVDRGVPNDSFGRLVWNESERKLFFIAIGLDSRPIEETYQIWVAGDGRYYSIGTFNPGDDGFVRFETTLEDGIDSYQSAIVTIERAGGELDRSGPSVFVTDLSALR